jgi:hypothetical protein
MAKSGPAPKRIESDTLVIVKFISNTPKKNKSNGYDEYDDYYDEEVSYTKGNYGKAIICLADPRIFMIIDNGKNGYLYDYINTEIIGTLEKLPRPLPYYIDDLAAPDVREALTDRYREDTGKQEGFISVESEYLDMSKRYTAIRQSKKLEELGVSQAPLNLLKLMEKKNLFKRFS